MPLHIEPTSYGLSLKVFITLFNTYFESITEWLPEGLGLYRIIFDAVYSSWILSLLLFTLDNISYNIVGSPSSEQLNYKSAQISEFVRINEAINSYTELQ